MLSGIRPLVFIHGFLGRTEDWRPFAMADRDICVDFWPLARSLSQLPQGRDPFDAAAEVIEETVGFLPEKPVLIGYSMGARLAMQALLKTPSLFQAAVLISGNPGLRNTEEREARLVADRQWAERFRSESWPDVLAAWDRQGVLQKPSFTEVPLFALSRDENNFDREALAAALEFWSLSRQNDLRAGLRSLPLPILYLTGESDSKFCELNRELVDGSKLHQHRIIPSAGHRVPWENSTAFVANVEAFLHSVR